MSCCRRPEAQTLRSPVPSNLANSCADLIARQTIPMPGLTEVHRHRLRLSGTVAAEHIRHLQRAAHATP
jgi:hypothetical protein